MKKKQIVSIEDRIPKLKHARKKKANRRLIFYLSIFFFLISIIVYLQSPLSYVRTIHVTGNISMNEEEVIKQSKLTDSTNIWTINKTKIKENMKENAIVKSVEVDRKLPWTVKIQIEEYARVGYIKDEGFFYPILGNGKTLTTQQKTLHGDAPLLINFTDDAYLQKMTKELELLPEDIFNLISEVHWKPTDKNKNKIILYMNDGFIVEGTTRGFADKMQVYPSIVSQIEAGSKGIIHIGVGAYFESFEQTNEEPEEEVETEE